MKSSEEQQQELFQKVAEQVLIRSAFASDAYLGIITTISSLFLPVYVVALRFLLDQQKFDWISLEAIPALLLVVSILVISFVRFPPPADFDTKQAFKIYEDQQKRTNKLRPYSIFASWLAIVGLTLSIFTLGSVSIHQKDKARSSNCQASLSVQSLPGGSKDLSHSNQSTIKS